MINVKDISIEKKLQYMNMIRGRAVHNIIITHKPTKISVEYSIHSYNDEEEKSMKAIEAIIQLSNKIEEETIKIKKEENEELEKIALKVAEILKNK